MMRDAKITQIYEGTNQIQRVVMARAYCAEFRAARLSDRCLTTAINDRAVGDSLPPRRRDLSQSNAASVAVVRTGDGPRSTIVSARLTVRTVT